MNKTEWYKDWFDTKYYHILYQDRNIDEAKQFIDHLVAFLNPPKNSTMLDLACGKGRHSKTLADYGYSVTGIDLSENSIQEANAFAHEHLHFDIHDMRCPYRQHTFNYVFNLFTSFGYFQTEQENLDVLQSVHTSLTKQGIFVLDFMNVDHVVRNLVEQEEKEIDGIVFKINRYADTHHIIKHITCIDNNKTYAFEERVQRISEKDFVRYFKLTNFQIENVFGDYSLQTFDPKKSNRLIFIVRKKQT